MNNIDKSFETLVMNIFIYYQQEYQSITSKLDNCLKITKECIYNPISKKKVMFMILRLLLRR